MQSGRDDYYFQKQTMLFIFLRATRAKTIGYNSPTRFKHQPNPLLKINTN